MAEINKAEIFKNAPIVLAILQIRYDKLNDFDSEKIKEIGKTIKEVFPKVADNVLHNFKLDNSSETKFSLDKREINGVFFDSEGHTKDLVVGVDKFTFQIHSNYTNWNDFQSETKKLWELFYPILKDLKITGLSIRYLNRINLPVEVFDIRKYFTTFIQSETGDHFISNFQFRYTTIKDNNIIHIGQGVDAPIENKLPYFFDIDAIHIENIDNKEEIIWNIFENLRNIKNEIFNDGLTEETKNLIR